MGDEDIVITFETLYDILMREKQKDELLELDKNFFDNIQVYLNEKKKVLDKVSLDSDLFSMGEKEKIESELKNIRKILKDLYERREKKIIELALNKSRAPQSLEAGNLLESEKRFFDELVELFDKYRLGILQNLVTMKKPQVKDSKEPLKKEPQKELVTLKFVAAVPKFVAEDMGVYGPFDENDMASLPREAATILIEKKRAVRAQK